MEQQLATLTESVQAPAGQLRYPTADELAQLRANQVKIANELARFSIACPRGDGHAGAAGRRRRPLLIGLSRPPTQPCALPAAAMRWR